MRLAVELYGVIVGHIDAQGPQDFDFTVSTEAISRFGINSDVLSVAVPLTDRPPRRQATELLQRAAARRGHPDLDA